MASEERDPLDRLLDDALVGYVSQEPRPGLALRVLERVRAEGTRSTFPLLRWALPVAALASALTAIAVWNYRAPATPPPQIARIEVSRAPAAVATAEPAKLPRPKARPARRARVPKEPAFPMRTPLTQEERALLAFVRSSPEHALRAFAERVPANIEPLRIDEIQVPPLRMSDGAK